MIFRKPKSNTQNLDYELASVIAKELRRYKAECFKGGCAHCPVDLRPAGWERELNLMIEYFGQYPLGSTEGLWGLMKYFTDLNLR